MFSPRGPSGLETLVSEFFYPWFKCIVYKIRQYSEELVMLIDNLQSAYLRLAKADLTPTALRTLLLMLAKASTDGLVRMSKPEIAEGLEVNPRTVFTAVQELQKNRFVSEVVESPGAPNWYKLHEKIVDACLGFAHGADPERDGNGGQSSDQFTFVVTGRESPKVLMQGQPRTLDHSIQTHDHLIQTHDHLIETTHDHSIQTHDLSIKSGDGLSSVFKINNKTNNKDLVILDPESVGDERSSFPTVSTTTDWMDEQANRLRDRFDNKRRSLIICEGYQSQLMAPILLAVAKIHNQLPALEADEDMRSSNDAFTAIVSKMQNVTVAIWHLGIRTEAELYALGNRWYSEHFSGKAGNPPLGNQFVEFATTAIHRKNTRKTSVEKNPAKPNAVVQRQIFNPFNRPPQSE